MSLTSLAPGTLLYMAPELFHSNTQGLSVNDYQLADMWAVGITSFFILTKRVPFKNTSGIRQYTGSPRAIFSRNLLEHCQVTEAAQSFVCQALNLQTKARLNPQTAKDHIWIQSWLSEASTPGSHSP